MGYIFLICSALKNNIHSHFWSFPSIYADISSGQTQIKFKFYFFIFIFPLKAFNFLTTVQVCLVWSLCGSYEKRKNKTKQHEFCYNRETFNQ